MIPPPMVVGGDGRRRTKRSPARATIGVSRTSRAPRAPPGASAPPATTTRAPTSLVPRWRRTHSRGRSGRAASSRSATSPRRSREAVHAPSSTRTPPRDTSSTPTAARGDRPTHPRREHGRGGPMVLHTAHAYGAVGRKEAKRRLGRDGPAPDRPGDDGSRTLDAEGPVDGHPEEVVRRADRQGNELSSEFVAKRGDPQTGDDGGLEDRCFSSALPCSTACRSSRTNATQSSSTVSRLVSTTTPARTPSSERMAKCSRVWGMTPSSAATTRSARSMPVAPASIVRTKASCPGTSTSPTVPRPSSAKGAKPSSIVMPRRFSSGRRSVSTPVRARTSAVLPWSMWPAVPMIIARRRPTRHAVFPALERAQRAPVAQVMLEKLAQQTQVGATHRTLVYGMRDAGGPRPQRRPGLGRKGSSSRKHRRALAAGAPPRGRGEVDDTGVVERAMAAAAAVERGSEA
jgi:hypothetical protein